MKHLFLTLSLLALFCGGILFADGPFRGGGGGGGGPRGGGGPAPRGGGGAPRVSQGRGEARPVERAQVQQRAQPSERFEGRTPSMSRVDGNLVPAERRPANFEPARGGSIPQQANRGGTPAREINRGGTPTREELKQFLGSRPGTTLPADGRRISSREELQKFFQKNRGELAKPGNPAKPLPNRNPQELKNQFVKKQQQNLQVSRTVQNQVLVNHPQMHNWFNDSFFNNHNFHPFFHNHGANWWWKGNGWWGLNRWFGWGWGYPVYYSDGYPIYYNDPGYPVPATSYANEPTYYTPNPTIYAPSPISNVPQNPSVQAPVTQTAQNEEWLPLGIYVAAKSEAAASHSSIFIQLAVNKEGDLAGTYYNAATDELHPLEGLVDQDTQEVVWKVTDNPDSPIMSTGLYNLTEAVAQIKVNFEGGTVQDWVLVRINQ